MGAPVTNPGDRDQNQARLPAFTTAVDCSISPLGRPSATKPCGGLIHEDSVKAGKGNECLDVNAEAIGTGLSRTGGSGGLSSSANESNLVHDLRNGRESSADAQDNSARTEEFLSSTPRGTLQRIIHWFSSMLAVFFGRKLR